MSDVVRAASPPAPPRRRRRRHRAPFASTMVCVCAVVIAAMGSITSVRADLYHLLDQSLPVGALFGRVVGMYSADDIEAADPGKGRSYVSMSVDFNAGSEKVSRGSAEVLVVRRPNLSHLGVAVDTEAAPSKHSQRYLCCSKELVSRNKCTTPNKIILSSAAKETVVFHRSVEFLDSTDATLHGIEGTFEVDKSALYIVVLANCDVQMNRPLTLGGHIEWMNPYGYLPGRLFGYLLFYKVMAGISFLSIVVWLSLNVMRLSNATIVQHTISLLLILSFAECTSWYYDMSHMNHHGTRNFPNFLLAIIISGVRNATLKSFIIALALGWGVSRQSLGDVSMKLTAFAAATFTSTTIRTMVIRYNHSQVYHLSPMVSAILSLVVGITHIAACGWTLMSLASTKEQLIARQQTHKLTSIVKLERLLYCLIGVLLLFSLASWHRHRAESSFEAINASDGDTLTWRRSWFFSHGFWELLMTGTVLAVAMLWVPAREGTEGGAERSNVAYSQVALTQDGSTMGKWTMPHSAVDEEDDVDDDDGAAMFTITDEM